MLQSSAIKSVLIGLLLAFSGGAAAHDVHSCLYSCVDNCLWERTATPPAPSDCSPIYTVPTVAPTSSPTTEPTVTPTSSPTIEPTVTPTLSPTIAPTLSPTSSPTTEPTKMPTLSPTIEPTVTPTEMPTLSPTIEPTVTPTLSPTTQPSKSPEAPTASPNGVYQMTVGFPLGSCKMGSPSLPYEFSLDRIKNGEVCLKMTLVPDYLVKCAQRKLKSACEMMVKNVNKIVFHFNQQPECGISAAEGRRHLNLFVWTVKHNGRTEVAAKYQIFSNDTNSGAHAIGDVNMFKYVISGKTSLQLDINRGPTFRKNNDATMNGYRVCMVYDSDMLDLPYCIANQNRDVKYSFYDPYKTICTTGVVKI